MATNSQALGQFAHAKPAIVRCHIELRAVSAWKAGAAIPQASACVQWSWSEVVAYNCHHLPLGLRWPQPGHEAGACGPRGRPQRRADRADLGRVLGGVPRSRPLRLRRAADSWGMVLEGGRFVAMLHVRVLSFGADCPIRCPARARTGVAAPASSGGAEPARRACQHAVQRELGCLPQREPLREGAARRRSQSCLPAADRRGRAAHGRYRGAPDRRAAWRAIKCTFILHRSSGGRAWFIPSWREPASRPGLSWW